MKKVSLLMMSYNSLGNVKKTLKSVGKQDYPNIELVLSDGGSTDGTVEFVKEYEKKTRFELNWISESDNGLYDAMNKDILRASGDYLLVFNDRFIDTKAISKLVQAIETNHVDGAYADLVYTEGKKIKRWWKMGEGKITRGWLPGHPTMMLKREVYDKYGLYDTSYRIAADYEFMSRILKDGSVKLAYVPEMLVGMFYGGASSGGLKNYMKSFDESVKGLKANGYKFALLITIIRTFRTLFQFIHKEQAIEELKKLKEERKVENSR